MKINFESKVIRIDSGSEEHICLSFPPGFYWVDIQEGQKVWMGPFNSLGAALRDRDSYFISMEGK